MWDMLGIELEEPGAWLAVAGLMLGVLFGALAQRSRFCLRRAVVESGSGGGFAPMAGIWAVALLVAVAGAQALEGGGIVEFADTPYRGETLPLGALVLGGLMFGWGMVLTRGCASRLLVLSGQGNLRAATVILLFAALAYITLRGAIAPLRVAFTDATAIEIAATAPEGALRWALVALVAVAAGLLAWRSGASRGQLTAGAGVGALVVLGWYTTGVLLFDDFDPVAPQSLATTGPASEALFWSMTATAGGPGFGSGLIGGVLLGAFLAAALSRELRLEGFSEPGEMLRYAGGGALMAVGGVMAGGCTLGAGLTGVSTLSLAPVIALAAIVTGAKLASGMENAVQMRRAHLTPAE